MRSTGLDTFLLTRPVADPLAEGFRAGVVDPYHPRAAFDATAGLKCS